MLIYVTLGSKQSYGQRRNILQSFCSFEEQKAKCEVFDMHLSPKRQKHSLYQYIDIAVGLCLKKKSCFYIFLLLT